MTEDDQEALYPDDEEPQNVEDSDDETQYFDTPKGKHAKTLQLTLQQCLSKSKFDKTPHHFMPEGDLADLIPITTIGRCLGAKRCHRDLVEYVDKHARKAFAIATFARLNTHVAMNWFKRRGLTDNDLPLTEQKAEVHRSTWRRFFYDAQWKFCAPVFNTDDNNHDLEEARIIPFVEMALLSVEGSFGQVSRAIVHRKHILPNPKNHRELAIKEFKASSGTQQQATEHWEREVKALKMMNNLDQDHIVLFITAFRRLRRDGEEHYVMFEWADGGNLRTLWEESMPSPSLDIDLIKLVTEQIHGLARALSAAHNLDKIGVAGASYRHGDLKPENILVFKDGGRIGRLKIGDWGEAKYQDRITAIRSRRTTSKFGTQRYEAPEMELGVKATLSGQSTKRRTRLSDVWALGCITLEFIVWTLYGKKCLERFNNDLGTGAFYIIDFENGKKVAKVHPNAIAWMDRMAELPMCKQYDTALGDLLDIVRNNLLVVNLPLQLGSELANMDRDQSSANSAYGTKGMDVAKGLEDSDEESTTSSIFEEGISAENPIIVLTPAGSSTSTKPQPIPAQPTLKSGGPKRWRAKTLRDRLYILITEDQPSYWEVKTEQLEAPTGLKTVDLSLLPGYNARSLDSLARGDYSSPELDEHHWQLLLDNEAARGMFKDLSWSIPYDASSTNGSSPLCGNCRAFRAELRKPGFDRRYRVKDLSIRASTGQCALCGLLWRSCKRTGAINLQEVRFYREGAFVKMENAHNAVLSLVVTPESSLSTIGDFQHGFVELPKAGSPTHLGAIRSWLQVCDESHHCKPPLSTENSMNIQTALSSSSQTVLPPTRLLFLGSGDDDKIFLQETKSDVPGGWVALSHKWGTGNFKTTVRNVEKHKSGMSINTLPATFRDAIIVTRALKKQYLWIDSLCIIQGKEGDFQKEATRMADVYSGAYCVIAASCADNHFDGFLKSRAARDYVTIPDESSDQAAYHICETIDNFKRHVLDGSLSLRGWVLQEHALARRTLFFTEHQTYFECKLGVKCETSTRLKNVFADFLGDSDFPSQLHSAKVGEKILRIQKLYKDYSRLGLTKLYDRPVAIDGVQQKLIQTMEVSGGYGIIDDKQRPGWLRRSLLWSRDRLNPALTRIKFPSDSAVDVVPTWSWMAYNGGIDYLQPEFGSVDWEPIQSPWSQTRKPMSNIALVAKAWKYNPKLMKDDECNFTFDLGDVTEPEWYSCVILGRDKDTSDQDRRKNWVLIIAPTARQDEHGNLIYERIGAGYVSGRCLSHVPCAESVHIH